MMKIKDFLNKTLIRDFCHFKRQINQSGIAKTRGNKVFFKHETLEKGRSMVELLGVLAVIGILSIGGIAGYRFAMDKYRANDILNSVNMRAVDTINLYQNKTLPDLIDSWENTTSSGFPIEIVTVPEADAFHVYVDEVSSSVCKQVVNLNWPLPTLIHIAHDETAEYLYENNPEICDTEQNQNITMTFTFGLNGAVPYCLSDDDCPSKCMKCNQAKRVCYSTCNKDSTESKCCADNDTCVACCSDSDCPGQQICHPVDHTCTEISEQCAENQFRSKSGACINCTHAGNVIIDPNVKINADVLTQQEMCLACNGRWTEEINDNTYCSRICTTGINFRSFNGQCVSCTTPGFHRIDPHDPEALNQCVSCPGHIWIRTILQGQYYCTTLPTCPDQSYMSGHLYCRPCNAVNSLWLHSINQISGGSMTVEEYNKRMQKMCTDCPGGWLTYNNTICYTGCKQPADEEQSIEICQRNHWSPECKRQFMDDEGVCYPCSQKGRVDLHASLLVDLAQSCLQCGRVIKGDYCYPVCEQPPAGSVESETCLTNPTSDSCKRTFQGEDGNCYGCAHPSNVYIGSDTDRKALCTACGRSINSAGYCISPTTTECEVDTFMDNTQNCVSCDVQNAVNTLGETVSKCVSNCKKNATTNQYSADGTLPTRQFYNNVCYPTCPTGTFIRNSCFSCNDLLGRAMDNNALFTKSCQDCGNRTIIDGWCTLKVCPNVNASVKRFHGPEMDCYACNDNRAIGMPTSTLAECESCTPDRIVTKDLGNQICVLIQQNGSTPVSGICNSIGNGTHANFEAGDGKYFRDGATGQCVSCDSPTTHRTSREQCESCPDRRYVAGSGNCIYGLCTDGESFLKTTGTTRSCISCSKHISREPIENTTESKNSCTACQGDIEHRVMTKGNSSDSDFEIYCTEACFGDMFQSVSDGKCQFCSDTSIGRTEIGSDSTSRDYCTACTDRILFTETVSGQVSYYCSAVATDGESFWDVSGNAVHCTNSANIRLPDYEKARKKCRACGRRVDENTNTCLARS